MVNIILFHTAHASVSFKSLLNQYLLKMPINLAAYETIHVRIFYFPFLTLHTPLKKTALKVSYMNLNYSSCIPETTTQCRLGHHTSVEDCYIVCIWTLHHTACREPYNTTSHSNVPIRRGLACK